MNWTKKLKTRKGKQTGRTYRWFVLKYRDDKHVTTQVIVDEGDGHYPPGKSGTGPAAECVSGFPRPSDHPYYASPTNIALSSNGTTEMTVADLQGLLSLVAECKVELKRLRDADQSDA